jgi:hypothetical protein
VDGDAVFMQRCDSMDGQPTIPEDEDTASIFSNDDLVRFMVLVCLGGGRCGWDGGFSIAFIMFFSIDSLYCAFDKLIPSILSFITWASFKTIFFYTFKFFTVI